MFNPNARNWNQKMWHKHTHTQTLAHACARSHTEIQPNFKMLICKLIYLRLEWYYLLPKNRYLLCIVWLLHFHICVVWNASGLRVCCSEPCTSVARLMDVFLEHNRFSVVRCVHLLSVGVRPMQFYTETHSTRDCGQFKNLSLGQRNTCRWRQINRTKSIQNCKHAVIANSDNYTVDNRPTTTTIAIMLAHVNWPAWPADVRTTHSNWTKHSSQISNVRYAELGDEIKMRRRACKRIT